MGAAGGSGLLAAGVLGVLGVLRVASGTAATDEPPAHALAEVLSCQPATPSLDLSVTFDTDQLYWFHFPASRWTPRLPDLPPWPPTLETPDQLLGDVRFCQRLLKDLTDLADRVLPESKGVPVASVFPVRPAALGEANTLVCMVENIFPPAVDIAWQLGGVPVTRGVTHTPYTPTPDLAFVRFSYLPATPAAGDVYACVVTRRGDNSSVLTYWVPQVPEPPGELELALCGAATALGILLALLGAILGLVARRGARG